jgi:hypothetical protein
MSNNKINCKRNQIRFMTQMLVDQMKSILFVLLEIACDLLKIFCDKFLLLNKKLMKKIYLQTSNFSLDGIIYVCLRFLVSFINTILY